MAAFELSVLDVVKISLSAHACLILRALLERLVDWALPLLASRSSMVTAVERVNNWTPGVLARVLTEQSSLLILVVLALMALSHTTVSVVPFGYQAQPIPSFLIRLVLCLSAARYIVLASWILLGRERNPILTVSESGSQFWDLLSAVMCAGTSLVCLGYRQNLLLGMTLPFLELSSIVTQCCCLAEIYTRTLHAGPPDLTSRPVVLAPRCVSLVACTLCLVSRIGLPTLFLALALQWESPLTMDRVPLVWFFLSCAFATGFHMLIIYRAILRANFPIYHGKGSFRFTNNDKECGYRDVEAFCVSGGVYEPASSSTRFVNSSSTMTMDWICLGEIQRRHTSSDHDHSNCLTNTIYKEISVEQRDRTKRQFGRCNSFKCGLLRPCDSRDLCCSSHDFQGASSCEEVKRDMDCSSDGLATPVLAADKINVVNRKDLSKTWLFYRSLTNSLSSNPSVSNSSSSCPSTESLISSRQPRSSSRYDPWVFPAELNTTVKPKLQSLTYEKSSQLSLCCNALSHSGASEDSDDQSLTFPLLQNSVSEQSEVSSPGLCCAGLEGHNGSVSGPKDNILSSGTHKDIEISEAFAPRLSAKQNQVAFTDRTLLKSKLSTHHWGKLQSNSVGHQVPHDCTELLRSSSESSMELTECN